jgi:Domain of unknown function (DUF397)
VIKASASTWTKSSYSNGQGNCVEVKYNSLETITVRDSKNEGPELAVSDHAWSQFIQAIRHGDFDI